MTLTLQVCTMGFKEFTQKLLGSVVLLAVGWLAATFVLTTVLFGVLRKGLRSVFYWKDRNKDGPPLHYKAWDVETRKSPGPATKPWNHAYVTVPESGMRFHYVYSGKVPNNIAISDIDSETVLLNESANEDKRPKLIVCAHGYPENWFSWRHILRYFDEAHPDIDDHFVLALDMRGYGDSDKPDGYKSYHVNNTVCDIKGIALALGYEKIILVGHDWGGYVTWEVAKIYPQLVEKIIIMNGPEKRAAFKALRQNPALIMKSWYMCYYLIPYLPELVMRLSDFNMIDKLFNGRKFGICNHENRLTEEEVEVFKYSLRHSTTPPINYYRAMVWPFAEPGPPLLYPQEDCEEDPLQTIPILIIWGDADQAVAIEILENMRKYLNESIGSKVELVKGASHWVQQDNPEETIRHMTNFLK